MAAALSKGGKLWRCDAAATVDTADLNVVGINFYNPTGGAGTCTVQDASDSSALFSAAAPAGWNIPDSTPRRWPNGFKIAAITAGTFLEVQLA